MATTSSSAPPQLRQRRLGVLHLVFFTVAASAPLTVLGGGVTTTYAVTGNLGTPLSFIVLAVALALFAVGYAAMSRHVANAGAFYSYLAKGLGPAWAVTGAFVALVSYNAIQIGLYGLFGFGANQFLLALFGVDIPWWVLGAVALVLVALLGVLRVDLNANVLAVLLVLEIIAVILYDIGAFGHPAAAGGAASGLSPAALFVPGVGAVFAFGIAAFIGFESGAIYSEECRNPRITVARATYIAVAFTGIFYCISAWAMLTTVGGDAIQGEAQKNGPGVVFAGLAEHWGPVVADVSNTLFLTSVFAALLSFHNGVARYLFALGREQVLPPGLARIGARSGGPVAGSLVQTVLAVIVVALFVIAGADPLLDLFTWLSGMAAVGVVLLMAGTSASVVGYFRSHPQAATTWQRTVAPAAATVVLVVLGVLLIANFDALLGSDPTSPLRWVLPGIVLLAAVVGTAWALALRASRPDVYAGIGNTAMAPVEDEATPRLELPEQPLQ
jgi:amino acid transporter